MAGIRAPVLLAPADGHWMPGEGAVPDGTVAGDAPAPAGGMADAVRRLVRGAVAAAGSGDARPALGMAAVATVLWTRFLRADAADPHWPDRDRFVLSDPRGAPLLYALLCLSGYGGMEAEVLRRFRRLDSAAGGAPDHRDHPGIEVTAGPPGQGIATAVGLAVAERMLAARFGRSLVDHRTWVMAAGAELAEGVCGEAAALAGQLRLGRLTVLFDEEGADPEAPKRFAALGWATKRVDGGNPAEVAAALTLAARSQRPMLLACATAGNEGAGEGAGGDEDGDGLAVPEDAAAEWARAGVRGTPARRAWLKRLNNHPLRAEFERVVAGRLPEGWHDAAAAARAEAAAAARAEGAAAARAEGAEGATADAARRVFAVLLGAVPELVVVVAAGGDAGPGLGLGPGSGPTDAAVSADSFNGRLVSCGARAGAAAALANGVALHGGLLPAVAGTLVATDAMRPALRLAARMRQRVVFLLGDDSIGVGEEGASFQPVEHLAGLRALPGLHVLRPADAVEAAECWELALRRADGPSVLALSRQAVPPLRADAGENRSARGGYVLAEAEGPRAATLVASGSEVAVAMEARRLLAAEGVAVAVVSLPCWELFAAQDAGTRAAVLGEAPRVGVEAASPFGWERWLGAECAFLGVDGYGASAPAEDLFRHFGITPEAVATAVRKLLPPARSTTEEGS